MKTLTEYKKNGWHFTIERRQVDFAIACGRKNGLKQFEVISIQKHHGREIGGITCEPAEYPPSNEQWGSKGWTFNDLQSAVSFY